MDKRVKNILELINKYNDCYIVGGYVRDYLLGINSNDYDICTSATIDKLKEILYEYEYTIENDEDRIISFPLIKFMEKRLELSKELNLGGCGIWDIGNGKEGLLAPL